MELGGAEKRNIEADGASSVTNLMACCNICPRDGSSSGGGQAAARMHSDAQYSAVPSDDKLLINVSPSNTNATQLEVETLLANWLAPEVHDKRVIFILICMFIIILICMNTSSHMSLPFY